ncbi:hypothetical protein [Enterococcus mundtii]|uniref:hypothetical protein n=1 Tax=Enterococcus mundtii TaxID=53346 RepID=UPI00403CC1AC
MKGITGLTGLITALSAIILNSSFLVVVFVTFLVIVLMFFFWLLNELSESRRHQQSMEKLDKKYTHEKTLLNVPKKPR